MQISLNDPNKITDGYFEQQIRIVYSVQLDHKIPKICKVNRLVFNKDRVWDEKMDGSNFFYLLRILNSLIA